MSVQEPSHQAVSERGSERGGGASDWSKFIKRFRWPGNQKEAVEGVV